MTFKITQSDNAPSLVSTLADGGKPIDLSNASNIEFHMEDEFKRVTISDDLSGSVNLLDASSGKVEYVFSQSETAETGEYLAEWEVTYDNGGVETFPVDGKVEIEIVGEIE